MIEAAASAKKDNRIPESKAGYTELAGAKKDGDCHKVRVAGGISKELGCCNYFQAESKQTQVFSCGTCEYERG